ncbi:MAG TPA: hypothetical protein DCM28_12350 [Phycisphaerales bacterium]|nr:hypothetical protein [Phycisphaerales bacterium]|tara:strand:+ start:7693 stop:7902 length:210 start_codon:yes stop_codon:yes gene_type:complete
MISNNSRHVYPEVVPGVIVVVVVVVLLIILVALYQDHGLTASVAALNRKRFENKLPGDSGEVPGVMLYR